MSSSAGTPFCAEGAPEPGRCADRRSWFGRRRRARLVESLRWPPRQQPPLTCCCGAGGVSPGRDFRGGQSRTTWRRAPGRACRRGHMRDDHQSAPPSAIWCWLVQLGSRQGGEYTYDWIENLCGLDMDSANEVVPQLPLRRLRLGAVGTCCPLANGPTMRIEMLQHGRAMVVRSVVNTWLWIFGLSPRAVGTRSSAATA